MKLLCINRLTQALRPPIMLTKGEAFMFGGKIGGPELLVLFFFAILVAFWSQIFHKAGHSRWLSLLLFVPLVNLVVFLWFAFSKWPVESEVEGLRMNLARLQSSGSSAAQAPPQQVHSAGS